MLGLGVRDPEAHHAHGHLRHFIRVWVIHEGAGTTRDKFIHKSFTWLNGGLIQSSNSIHTIGQTLSMPVNAGVLRELVRHKDPHAVALDHFDGGAWALPVVAPQVGLEAWGHLAHHWLGHQVKLFYAVVHTPGQSPTVECHHRVV